jgi:integrase/recombinase XerD
MGGDTGLCPERLDCLNLRCSAVASFQLAHLNIDRRVVFQDARAVKAKFRKSFETWFFLVGEDLEQMIIDWVLFLRKEKGWEANDPLFPNTRVDVAASGQFKPTRLERAPWASTGPIRAIVRDAFARAGLPYPNPHSFRETLVTLGKEKCKSWAEMQAGRKISATRVLRQRSAATGRLRPTNRASL